jgi:hypothetical protein
MYLLIALLFIAVAYEAADALNRVAEVPASEPRCYCPSHAAK